MRLFRPQLFSSLLFACALALVAGCGSSEPVVIDEPEAIDADAEIQRIENDRENYDPRKAQ